MSTIYKKFIEPSGCVARSPIRAHGLETTRLVRDKSVAGSRTQLTATLSPIASVVNSALSSTPVISGAANQQRRRYQRLIDATDFVNFDVHEGAERPSGRQQSERRPSGHHFHQHSTPEQGSREQCRSRQAAPCASQQARSCSQQRTYASAGQSASSRSCNSLNNSHLSAYEAALQARSERHAVAQAAARASPYNTNDPVLLEWLRSMRFQPDLECLTALQARTLASDENVAGALSVRNSQVAIQEMRLESEFILNLVDCLIEMLPVNFNTVEKFALDFSDLWTRLSNQTAARTRTQTHTYCNQKSNLTIINCTPRKSLTSARTLRPLDKLAVQLRNVCIELANSINEYQENYNSFEHIDNGQLEAMLRKIKEFYGKFVEISVRAECANIVRALEFDFSRGSLDPTLAATGAKMPSVDSGASLKPVRPYEASAATLPLKWALIALWQLTKDDGFICRTLTEKWQATTGGPLDSDPNGANNKTPARSVARRLDYSTTNCNQSTSQTPGIPAEYEKLYQICPNPQRLQEERAAFLERQLSKANGENVRPANSGEAGALSSALKNKQPVRQLSTIELLIDIIISQPNKHERIDMMNFVQNSKLVDVEELDRSVSAAFYTSNQYKVAALRILNHLCINEQAVKTILKCFSTPPPRPGQPMPENKIIKSVFECYQTAQEHIYQNETMVHAHRTPSRRSRKRARHGSVVNPQDIDCDEYSDYGSRQTNSAQTEESLAGPDHEGDDEGDDAVVKEAIRLLVQLTTPFHASAQGHDFYTLIGRFSIELLVRYLTNIIKSTTNREMILLSLSALANISFITTEPMKIYATNRIILEMFRASKARSKDLDLRDQSVTILANTADKNFLDIVTNGGLTFLLSCLEICPTRMSNYRPVRERFRSDSQDHYSNIIECNYERQLEIESTSTCGISANMENKPRDRKPIQISDEVIDDLDCVCDSHQKTRMPILCLSRLTPTELAAMERIHQKTAVAFARLSVDASTTQMVLQYGGVKQMIDLCKLSHRRNHSDTVLIACLAALRKMAKVIGCDVFRHYNALDLIELELNQALDIYGRLYASEV